MFRRATVNLARNQVPRRMFGAHVQHPTTGIEGAVRKVLKEDWQLVLGIMGFYTTLYMFSKLVGGGKKAPAAVEAAPVAVVASSGSMPSVDSPEFDKWISTEGNLEKMLA